jgi:hypothetical protein
MTMMVMADTEATDMTPLMTMAIFEDIVGTVGTADEAIVEAEEEAVTTVMILTPQSKRRSITSRRERSGTRASILNTRMNDTGTLLN